MQNQKYKRTKQNPAHRYREQISGCQCVVWGQKGKRRNSLKILKSVERKKRERGRKGRKEGRERVR